MARSSLYIGYNTLFGGIFDVFGGYPLLWGVSWGGMGYPYYIIYGGAGVYVRRPWISSHAEVPALTYYLGGESASKVINNKRLTVHRIKYNINILYLIL